MSKIDDVKDFLIGLVFYIGTMALALYFVEYLLTLVFG